MLICVLALSCRRKSRPLLIGCFNFSNACTYRSDLIAKLLMPVTDWRAPVILAELVSVAIRWVRQEALLGATLKIRSHYFHSNLIRTQLQKKKCCLLFSGKSHSTEDNRHFTLSPQWEHQIQIICFLVYLTTIYKLIIIRVEWQWWHQIKAVKSGFCSGLF
jgi:hypothetical protein